MVANQKRRISPLFLGLVVVGSAAGARAEDSQEAEALIRQGVELRQQSHDERALPLFQKAYQLARTPRTAGQLGLCELAIGYWLDAEHHLLESLASREHPWVAKSRKPLEDALKTARANIGEVVIEGSPPGAEVLVNRKPVGRLPLAAPVRLGEGPVDIELRASEYMPASRPLVVSGAVQQRLTIILEKVPGLANSAPSSRASIAVSPRAAAPGPIVPIETKGSGSTARGRTYAWILAGTSTAALVFGAVETVAWIARQNDFDNHLGPLPADSSVQGKNCGTGDRNFGGTGCQAIHDNLARDRALALVGYGIGGGLAIGSAILFATSGADHPTSDSALACAPNLVSKGVTCRLSF